MQRTRLSRYLAPIALFLLTGNATATSSDSPNKNNPQPEAIATFSSPLSYQMYNILAAEMYAHEKNAAQAALHYVAAAQQNNNVTLAKRAAELAMQANDNELARRALGLWTKQDAASLEAKQYQALLNIRAENYDEAVKDLTFIRDAAQKKEGHGFELVVSLLAMEPASNKTYQTFKRYVEKVDQSAAAQLILASMALNNDQFDETLKVATMVKKHGNTQQKQQASRLASKALMSLQRIPEALTELEPLLKNTKDSDLQLDYARMLVIADRRSEATALFKQVYDSQPDNLDVLYTLGLLYLEQKDYAFAEPLFKKLLSVPNRAAEASYFLGQIHEANNKPTEALDAYQKAIGSHLTAEAINRSVQLMATQKGVDETRKWLQTQLTEASTPERKASFLRAEGQLLHGQKRYGDAIDVFNQALKLSPENTDLLYARALSLEQKGDFKAAEADMRAILKQTPDDATILNGLGYMLTVNTNRYAEAEELIRKALAIHPHDAAILDSMGWVMYRTGKLNEAEKWLRDAYKQSQDPEIASHLVEVLSANGKLSEAKTILQDMLGKFPNDQLLIKAKEKLAVL